MGRSSSEIGISAVIPTWRRTSDLSNALARLKACEPRPAEILIHVDAGDDETEPWIRRHHPDVVVISSRNQIGPGGGRNKLVRKARFPLVASFDDDSYPIDDDFFQRLDLTFKAYPDAAIVACSIFHRNESIEEARPRLEWSSSFVGCGCAYRKADFLRSDGYLDLPIAYGAEELDLSIQLQEIGRRILQSDWLRVYHDTENEHHQSPEVNAAKIANVALLAYVRYPVSMWAYASLQVLNRVAFSIKLRRYAGVMEGVLSIPGHLWRHRHLRRPVSRGALQRFLRARSKGERVPWRIDLDEHQPVSSTADAAEKRG